MNFKNGFSLLVLIILIAGFISLATLSYFLYPNLIVKTSTIPTPTVTLTLIPVSSTDTPTPTATSTLTPTPIPLNYSMPVAIFSYLPPDSTGQNVDKSLTSNGDSLSKVSNWIVDQNNKAITDLTNGSKYHGYKNSSATPALKYSLYEYKKFTKAAPLKFWDNRDNGSYYVDYQTILITDMSVCDLVDNHGVKEIWIWGYQTNHWEGSKVVGVGILESNMAMGIVSKKFWQHGSYGNVSNDQWQGGGLDLPQCQKSYVVYTYSYSIYQGLPYMLHVHGHQIEQEMSFVDNSLWDSFTAKHSDNSALRGCGTVHGPPNTPFGVDYSYKDPETRTSDCQNWNPNRDGVAEQLSCLNWSCIDESQYYIWWMQNIPGLNNNLPYKNSHLRNWWDFMGDFDKALKNGKSLTKS